LPKIGEQELVYFGNTVNTASRIEQQCKSFGCSFLISGELVARIDLPKMLQAESKGVASACDSTKISLNIFDSKQLILLGSY
tara:strand:- start:969 stop:1214 length:246 start_codon:yes stop_codon:yes gene_type:complete